MIERPFWIRRIEEAWKEAPLVGVRVEGGSVGLKRLDATLRDA
jgi:hypothetical protein